MDFKTRFTGKIAHISKDGAFDTVIKTNEAKGIVKMPTTIQNEMGMTGGIGGDTGGPVINKGEQIIQYGQKSQYSQFNNNSYQRHSHMSHLNSTGLMMSAQKTGETFARGTQNDFDKTSAMQSGFKGNQRGELSSPPAVKNHRQGAQSQTQPPFHQSRTQSNTVNDRSDVKFESPFQNQVVMTKRNEKQKISHTAALNSNQKMRKLEDDKLYSANPFPGLSGSQENMVILQEYPKQNHIPQSSHALGTQYSGISYSGMQGEDSVSPGKGGIHHSRKQIPKPPSQSQNKRQHVDQQRRQNFANVSRQIVSSSTNLTKSSTPANKDQEALQKQLRSSSLSGSVMNNYEILRKNSPTKIEAFNPSSYPLPQQHQTQPLTSMHTANFGNNLQAMASAEQLKQQIAQLEQQVQFLNQQIAAQMPFGMQQQQLQMLNYPMMHQGTQQQLQQQLLMMQQMLLMMQNAPGGLPHQNIQNIQQQQQRQHMDQFVQNNQRQQSPVQNSLDTQSSSGQHYKQHTLQDYKNLQQAVQSMRMGGLGANIGSEEWEKARKKQEFYAEFGKQIRLQNMQKPLQKKTNVEKEVSRRERALEFARQVPKPKIKQQCEQFEETAKSNGALGQDEWNFQLQQLQMQQNDEEEEQNIMHELDMKHQQYAGELVKIKQMFK
ncbi:hypothetical protein FGO68_gene1885 [Halteria grandinella]|uniref:Uncharacterized protein n=1 Tax=Halteria grandinella TaxID=5974 RepID=A0A8J8T688_HALGN|nr:hypothetical protein FGO68_gene1885 [Halteria grandinella]